MTTVVPILDRDGRITWVEKGRGMGDIQSATGTANSVLETANAISSVQDAFGAKPTNQTLNEVSAVAGKVAQIALVVPPPYGELIAAAAGIVAVSAKVLSGIFGNGPAIDAQVRALRNTNDDLYSQVATLDDQKMKVSRALSQLNDILKANNFQFAAPPAGVSGLGSDLESEQAQNTSLQHQLAQKGQELQALIDTYTKTINQVYNAIWFKRTGQKIILFGMGALALGGIAWYLVRDIENKEK